MRIKLMPDYFCLPLWWDGDPDRIGEVRPDDIELSPELWDALIAWAARFDATLNQDDPLSSDFESETEYNRFTADGAALAERLRATLGPDVAIRYLPPEKDYSGRA